MPNFVKWYAERRAAVEAIIKLAKEDADKDRKGGDMNRIVIYVEGGVVEEILTAQETEILVIDHDADEGRVISTPGMSRGIEPGRPLYEYRGAVDVWTESATTPHVVEELIRQAKKYA